MSQRRIPWRSPNDLPREETGVPPQEEIRSLGRVALGEMGLGVTLSRASSKAALIEACAPQSLLEWGVVASMTNDLQAG